MDILHISISDKFSFDLSMTFVTFQTKSRIMITLLVWPNFKEYLDPFETISMFSTSVSQKTFDVDFAVTFVTFQSKSSSSTYLVSMIPGNS